MSPIKKLKQSVIRLLESRGYCVSFGEPATLMGIVSGFDKDDFFFVQIGAYDGREGDPIHDFVRQRHWKGLLVEPQPDAFAGLRSHYKDCPGLLFENAAITASGEAMPFYRLKPEYASLFHGDAGTLSSFDPEHILKHLSKPMTTSEALAVFDVPCIRLGELLEKHGITRIDFLQIDAEGLDDEIVRAIDFAKIKPAIIRFEHAHIDPARKQECIDLLLSHSYKLVIGAYDITAFQSRWMYD